MRRRQADAVVRVVGAAVLFSTGGAAIKASALPGMDVASLRSGIAAAALLLWLRGRVQWSARTLAVGAAYAATLILFVVSTKLTTAASAIFLQSTAPLYIAILAPLLLGERLRRRDLAFLAAAGAGLTLCFAGRIDATLTAPDPATGNLLGILCSLSWALTLLGLRWLEQAQPGAAVSAVVVGNLLAFSVGLPSLWPLPAATAGDWAMLAYLGVFQIGCAYVLLTGAVDRLPALHVSLLLLVEPVLNPVWTWLVHGERPGAWTLAGGAIIIAAASAQALYDARTPE
ncbi:MAG: DMT family transporter [Acidobacteria bacterium]|nr:DMT family transporter [Acidobacteriota bacterium]